MFKVIVVDDEPPILNAISKMIEETNNNFSVIGKALNGEDALELIKSLKPDVVFTDVKMPVLDGLELLGKLTDLPFKPLTIILSGYKEFEYAKKALTLGVYDYLIKPLNLDLLEKLLSNIFQKLCLTKKVAQITALENIMHGTPTSADLDLFEDKRYICFLLCAGPCCSYHSSALTPGKDFLARNNPEMLIFQNTKQLYSIWITDGDHENEKIILIGCKSESDLEFANVAKEVAVLLDSLDMPITIVATEIFHRIAQIGTKVKDLQNILKRYIVFGESQFIMENKLEQGKRKDTEEILSPSWVDIFSTLNLNRQNEGFKQNLKSLLGICESSHCRQLILEKILQEIFYLFCKKQDSKMSDRYIDIHMELNELITFSTSYKQLVDELCCLTDDLFDNNRYIKGNNEDPQEIIERIDEYIKSNYSKPINLQTLSDVFNFVPQYLGRKYKKIRGITPNDFIVQLRVNKAKELLKIEPPVSIKDIAESVGYEDPFYLSRIFKLVTGKSPSEFRNCRQ